MSLHTLWFWEQLFITIFLLQCLLMRPGWILIWHQFYAATHLHLNLLSSLCVEPCPPPVWTQDLKETYPDFSSHHRRFKLVWDDQNHWSWKTKHLWNKMAWRKLPSPSERQVWQRVLQRRWLSQAGTFCIQWHRGFSNEGDPNSFHPIHLGKISNKICPLYRHISLDNRGCLYALVCSGCTMEVQEDYWKLRNWALPTLRLICIYKVACEVKLENVRTVDQFPIFIPFASLPVHLGEVREMLRGKSPLQRPLGLHLPAAGTLLHLLQNDNLIFLWWLVKYFVFLNTSRHWSVADEFTWNTAHWHSSHTDYREHRIKWELLLLSATPSLSARGSRGKQDCAQNTEEHLNNATTTSSGRSVFCLQLPYLFSCAME